MLFQNRRRLFIVQVPSAIMRRFGCLLTRHRGAQANVEAHAVNNFGKNLALWVIIGLLLIALFNLFQGPSSRGPQTSLAFSDFLSEVQSGRVTDVVIQGDSISGHFQDGRSFNTYAPYDPNLVNRLTEHDVRISAQPLDENMPSLLGVLVSWFPMLLLIGVWVFFMRQ